MAIPLFDFFKWDRDRYIWLGTAVTFEEATAKIQAMKAPTDTEFLIFNEQTLERTTIKLEADQSRLHHAA